MQIWFVQSTTSLFSHLNDLKLEKRMSEQIILNWNLFILRRTSSYSHEEIFLDPILVNWIYTWIQFWYIHFLNTFHIGKQSNFQFFSQPLKTGKFRVRNLRKIFTRKELSKLAIEYVMKIFWVDYNMEMIGNINNHNCTRDTFATGNNSSMNTLHTQYPECKTIKSCVKIFEIKIHFCLHLNFSDAPCEVTKRKRS